MVLLGLSGCSLKSCSWFKSPELTQVKIEDLKMGEGEPVVKGQHVEIHYRGFLYDDRQKDNKGRAFDNSYDRNMTLSFTAGDGKVLKGWDEGVLGMKQHGLRRLTIPAKDAYGDRGAEPLVPPKAILVYEVELVSVKQ